MANFRVSGKGNRFINPTSVGGKEGFVIEDGAEGNSFENAVHIPDFPPAAAPAPVAPRPWYERPIGRIGIGVATGLVVAAALAALNVLG